MIFFVLLSGIVFFFLANVVHNKSFPPQRPFGQAVVTGVFRSSPLPPVGAFVLSAHRVPHSHFSVLCARPLASIGMNNVADETEIQ